MRHLQSVATRLQLSGSDERYTVMDSRMSFNMVDLNDISTQDELFASRQGETRLDYVEEYDTRPTETTHVRSTCQDDIAILAANTEFGLTEIEYRRASDDEDSRDVWYSADDPLDSDEVEQVDSVAGRLPGGIDEASELLESWGVSASHINRP